MRPHLPVLFAILGGCAASAGTSTDIDPAVPTAPAAPTGATSDAGTPSAQSAPAAPDLGPPAVQYVGRFDLRDPAGPRCSWPGCRIVANFSGTRVRARLREIDAAWMEGAPSEWDVVIDGATRAKLVLERNATAEHVLAEDLAPGEHRVELYKRSEAQNGTTQFLGFDFAGGALLPPPPRRTRRFEIIGDSAASGFGVEGVGPDCPGPDWGATWQNFRRSFGAVLAERFDAEVHGSVYSGKGVAQNIHVTDREPMPAVFPRADPNDRTSTWDLSSWVPDVVVIMLGGNDFAIGQPEDRGPATLAAFTDAYAAFLGALRDAYPAAHILAVTSPSTSDAQPEGRRTRTNILAGIDAALARRADPRMYAVAPPVAQPGELTGCNGHGSPEYHRRLADDLEAVVRAKTGW